MISEKYICSKCIVVSDVVIEICQDCLEILNAYDQNLDEQQIKHYNQQIAQYNQKQKKIKLYNRNLKLQRKRAKNLLQKTGDLLKQIGEISKKQKQQLQIARKLINQSLTKSNLPFFRKFNTEQTVKRGPIQAEAQKQMYKYQKPYGYFGYPLRIPLEKTIHISKNGNENQWLVAYHGTSLSAVLGILDQGFKPGPRQDYKNNKNLNTLSYSQDISGKYVGQGIFCTNGLKKAQQNNRCTRYVCVLQCRINPYKAKIAEISNGICNYIINDGRDIIPYRLLLKLK